MQLLRERKRKKDTLENVDIDQNDIPSDEGGIEFKNLETACEQGKVVNFVCTDCRGQKDQSAAIQKSPETLFIDLVLEETNELPTNHQTMDAGIVTTFGY